MTLVEAIGRAESISRHNQPSDPKTQIKSLAEAIFVLGKHQRELEECLAAINTKIDAIVVALRAMPTRASAADLRSGGRRGHATHNWR
jgi:hypothetical protein